MIRLLVWTCALLVAAGSAVACGADSQKPAKDGTSIVVTAPDGGSTTQQK